MSAPAEPQRGGLSWLANPYLLLALASLTWSGNHIVGRAIAGEVPPLSLSAVRWVLPALVLWPFARPHLKKDWPVIRRHIGIMLFLALMGGALFSAGQYVGLQYTTALNVSLLNSFPPVLILAVGAVVFRDPLVPLQVLGILTSLAGVVVVVTRADLDLLLGLRFNKGDLIILANMAVWAVYTAFLRKRPRVHSLSFNFVFAVIAAAGSMPFLVAEHLSGYTFKLNLMTLGAILYVAIFPSLIGFAFWARGVEAIGANRAGAFLHLVPLYSALLASTLLGEDLRTFHVVGFALILGGVWFAARRT